MCGLEVVYKEIHFFPQSFPLSFCSSSSSIQVKGKRKRRSEIERDCSKGPSFYSQQVSSQGQKKKTYRRNFIFFYNKVNLGNIYKNKLDIYYVLYLCCKGNCTLDWECILNTIVQMEYTKNVANDPFIAYPLAAIRKYPGSKAILSSWKSLNLFLLGKVSRCTITPVNKSASSFYSQHG